MKNYFELNAEGKNFVTKYLTVYIPILALGIITGLETFSVGILGLLNYVQGYLQILLGFVIFSYIVPLLKYRESNFAFSGTLGEFAPKALLWYFLSTITLGIYIPWAIRNVVQYHIERTTYNGKNGSFNGKPARLLTYFVLFIILFWAVLTIAILIVFGDFSVFYDAMGIGGFGAEYNLNYDVEYYGTIPFIIIFGLMLIVLIYLYLKWLIDAQFAGYTVRFLGNWTETIGMLIVQTLLTVITLGIYTPAAYINIYRYILGNSEITNTEAKGNFGFDTGITGKGFLLIWGQAILTIITLGIYGAWAICKVTNWFAKHSYIEGNINLGEEVPQI